MRRHGAPLLEDESSSRRCTSAVIEMVCTHGNVSACLCSLSSLSGGGALGVLVLVVLRWPASGTHACGECNDGTPRSAKLWLLTPPLWRMSINAQRRIRASLASARATGVASASPARVGGGGSCQSSRATSTPAACGLALLFRSHSRGGAGRGRCASGRAPLIASSRLRLVSPLPQSTTQAQRSSVSTTSDS